MIIEIKIPSPGESVTQVQLASWLVSDGQIVDKDTEIVEIDSDKATFAIAAPQAGKVKHLANQGDTLAVGFTVASLDTSFSPETSSSLTNQNIEKQKPLTTQAPVLPDKKLPISPLAKKILHENQLQAELINNQGHRITKNDVIQYLQKNTEPENRKVEKQKLSALRLKLSERLVAVKNETAMLTTFNEVDMTAWTEIKNTYNEAFKEKHGVGIGLMSFFTKAVTLAFNDFPVVNSHLINDELHVFKYVDMGIAVSAPKGLLVPVIRNAETLSIPQLEIKIKELASKARDNKITLDELTGGTFTITNGGVFGSLMSTPILNPPQSAILGMHRIQDRPVVINKQIVIRPMMYIALSYDHRVIDGRESVGFIIKVKEYLENPHLILQNSEKQITHLLEL